MRAKVLLIIVVLFLNMSLRGINIYKKSYFPQYFQKFDYVYSDVEKYSPPSVVNKMLNWFHIFDKSRQKKYTSKINIFSILSLSIAVFLCIATPILIIKYWSDPDIMRNITAGLFIFFIVGSILGLIGLKKSITENKSTNIPKVSFILYTLLFAIPVLYALLIILIISSLLGLI